ncbi:MAG: GntR family transcriptional regulator [Gammaproteobacteria bacterium]
MLRKLVPEPDLVDRVHASLLDAILSGEMEPGTRYTQEALASRLGVSRQPVLQALRLLRLQGLIVDTPNRRGIEVAPLDAVFVARLYQLRAALDAAAARAAAHRARRELRNEGDAIIEEGIAATATGDLERLVRADLRFHSFIYEAADNPLLLETARQYWHHTRRAMTAYVRRAGQMSAVWSEHRRILDAIVEGDPARAAELSHDHASHSVQLLLAGSDDSGASAPSKAGTAVGAPTPRRKRA